MTCIVGIVNNNKVYIGGDTLGSNGHSKIERYDVKVFKKDNFIFGCCGSYRMGNLIRYKMKMPKIEKDIDVMEYMVVDFIDELRKTMREGGFLKTENGVDEGGFFLVGYKDRLFKVECDFQVAEVLCGYDSTGSGEDFALGSLYSTQKLTPRKRIQIALEAASFHCVSVGGEFTIINT